ncbi:AMP-dependent synthetase/ligase [Candidatus Nitrotoga fabula]|uniref:AMP-dependent synthetase and ligase n=1 Tax=Candidatus Nitrotoga fabula TaxID=2182327 RepID=A0A916BD46_9PROT|nr:long-chain fatty acid--CoA ligase [Candidatus Nitrotoga fabula]CAE6728287.1 AMP-dependent synthetase and ligase [Candidatus Nitrotoga fabula]
MPDRHDHLIRQDQAVTLHGLFIERVKRTPEATAYRYFDADANAWLSMSWAQARDQVARWQAALMREGLAAGDRVGIMLRNCPQWVLFDQAALSLGLVVVPLYAEDRQDNLAYVILDAGIKVLLFENAQQWAGLRGVCLQLVCVQRMISLDRIAGQAENRLLSVDDWLPAAGELAGEGVRDSGALATIMYTSGTRGRPKGVMLSHRNILFDADAALQTCPVFGTDTMLSFLPLSHAFERTVGYYVSMMAGSAVAFARSVPQLSEDLQAIRPTILVSVPRIYERIYAAIGSRLEEAPPLRRRLFALAVNAGWRRFEHAQGRAGWHPAILLWPLLRRLVADKVMARLGGRLRMTICGGAPLQPRISRLFVALGLPILQGYGLTETSPIVCANRLDNNFPASVGLPLPGVQVRISKEGVLQVKGQNVMLGYWNNEGATRAMIDADGWLDTGDLAMIDPTGHITITGHQKEIIVLSNGEKVPPADMEQAILRDNLFDMAMVHGEGRPYLVALVVMNPGGWENLAREAGVQPDAPESLLDPRIQRQVLQRIAEQTREFPGYARVRRVLPLLEPWSFANGLLTSTLKVRRGPVVERFAVEIGRLYQGH